MPYRRSSRRTTKRRPMRRNVASKKYVKAVVSRAVRSDLHYHDASLSSQTIGPAASPYTFNCLFVPQGDTQKSREGKKIQLASLQLRGHLYRSSGSATHDRVRLVLVLVRRQNSTPYAFTDVIDTSGVVQTDPSGFRKISAGLANNFKVLRDWTYDLGYTNSDKQTHLIRYYKKFRKPISVWFPGSTTTAPVLNDIVLFAISDCSVNYPVIDLQSRATFIP